MRKIIHICAAFLAAFFILFSFADVVSADTIINGGNILDGTLWTASSSPYIVKGGVYLQSGTTFTIGPGTSIIVDP